MKWKKKIRETTTRNTGRVVVKESTPGSHLRVRRVVVGGCEGKGQQQRLKMVS
jgi:hypothetical protein